MARQTAAKRKAAQPKRRRSSSKVDRVATRASARKHALRAGARTAPADRPRTRSSTRAMRAIENGTRAGRQGLRSVLTGGHGYLACGYRISEGNGGSLVCAGVPNEAPPSPYTQVPTGPPIYTQTDERENEEEEAMKQDRPGTGENNGIEVDDGQSDSSSTLTDLSDDMDPMVHGQKRSREDEDNFSMLPDKQPRIEGDPRAMLRLWGSMSTLTELSDDRESPDPELLTQAYEEDAMGPVEGAGLQEEEDDPWREFYAWMEKKRGEWQKNMERDHPRPPQSNHEGSDIAPTASDDGRPWSLPGSSEDYGRPQKEQQPTNRGNSPTVTNWERESE